MKKPTAGQVEYVELGGGSKAEVYQAESDSLLSRLTHSVKSGIGLWWNISAERRHIVDHTQGVRR